MIPRKELPDIGEYVVATVKEIYDYGAYVSLDEYGGLRAFLPWSEVATKWIRDIRDVLREGEKIVVRVIRVDRTKKEVDVSLKRVADTDKRKKMMWWKRYTRAASIIEMTAGKIGKSIEAAYKEVLWKLEDTYGDPLYALEEALISGKTVLLKAGVGEEWIEPLLNEAKRHMKLKEVVVRVKLTVQSLHSDGVERVRRVLGEIAGVLESEGVKYRLYTIGAPRYILEVYTQDYRTAEAVLDKALNAGEEVSRRLEVSFKSEREKT
ncbi:MAG: translation initiation factor IF-2 subunit alpha [Desulfurococcus sp.]|nr:translation initiation factor IF-2 subunit alpha [Desulfurococcus sp.]